MPLNTRALKEMPTPIKVVLGVLLIAILVIVLRGCIGCTKPNDKPAEPTKPTQSEPHSKGKGPDNPNSKGKSDDPHGKGKGKAPESNIEESPGPDAMPAAIFDGPDPMQRQRQGGVYRMLPLPEGLRPHGDDGKPTAEGPIDLQPLSLGGCNDAVDCAGISMSFCHDLGGVDVQTWSQGEGEWACSIRCNRPRPGENRKAFGVQPCEPEEDEDGGTKPIGDAEPPAEGEPCTPYDPDFVGPVDPPMCEAPPCPGSVCT